MKPSEIVKLVKYWRRAWKKKKRKSHLKDCYTRCPRVGVGGEEGQHHGECVYCGIEGRLRFGEISK